MTQNKAFTKIKKHLEQILKHQTNLEERFISLKGPAGTGKTYLVSKLVEVLKSEYRITITAPTHKAIRVLRENLLDLRTSNVSMKTLHSFLNLKVQKDFARGTQAFVSENYNKDLSKTDILIVDESSMVSNELYDYIVAATKAGRIQAVLFVGDEYQLLPVDSKETKLSFIEAQYTLTHIVRQARGSYIIHMATKAREIIETKAYISLEAFFDDDSFKNEIEFFDNSKAFYDDFCTPKTWAEKDKVMACFTNKSVDAHNRIIRTRYWKEQQSPEIVTLMKGDKVIFQQANVIDDKIVHQNSDIVTLSSAKKTYMEKLGIYFWACKDLANKPFKVIDPESQAKFDEIIQNIAQKAKASKEKSKKRTLWKIYFNLKETFINVKYIYSSTIHKLQGSTYETVYIDLSDLSITSDKDLMFRLLYVALTRASAHVKVLWHQELKVDLAQKQEHTIGDIAKALDDLELTL
jgi:ATP-dependent exoDNAse (exonuclease V) alpha subunit